MKIAILSKNRAGRLLTLNIFNKETYLFVEPQDFKLYQETYPQIEIINIHKNDKGVNYVRNYILDYFNEPILMLDDDIDKIYKRKNKKLIEIKREDKEKLFIIFQQIMNKGYAQATLSFCASNWMYDKDFKINTRAWCFHVLNIPLLKTYNIRFDENLSFFGDYDFTIQIINKGLKNISLYNYAFSCVKMGSNKGGLQMFDRKLMSSQSLDYMIKKWGEYIISKKNNNFLDTMEVQVKWKKIGLL